MPDKQIVAIDASTLDTWGMCNKKYELQFIKNLTTPYKNRNLDLGGMIHLMLKNYYTLKRDSQETSFDFRAAVESSVNIAYTTDSDLPAHEIEEAIYVFRGYCEKYEHENWIIHEVEKSFAVTLFDSESLQIIGQGIADIIGSTESLGMFIADHKKRSRREEENSLNNQRYMYTYALKIPNFYTNKLVFIKDPDRYTRQLNTYSLEQHEEWLEEVVMAVKQILAYTKIGFFRREPTSCDKFGGCQFRNFCNIAPSRREGRIGTEFFVGEKWDVGKILEEQGK